MDEVAADRAADRTLGGFSGGGLGLGICGDRLIAASSDAENALYCYDGLAELSAASAALASVCGMYVDNGHGLWVVSEEDAGSSRLFPNVPALTSASSSTAQFTHSWAQIRSGIYDSVGKKPIAGQVSGAGILVKDDPLDDTGPITPGLGSGCRFSGLESVPQGGATYMDATHPEVGS